MCVGGAGGVVINPSNLAGPTESSLFRQGEFLVRRFTPVPEPASVTATFAAGLGGVTWLRRRRAAVDIATTV